MDKAQRQGRGGRWLRRGVVGLVVLLALGFAWFNPDAIAGRLMLKPEDMLVASPEDPDYEALVPRYVELCATSQWRKNVAGTGNPFGHAVMYLKGACLDRDAAYPQLRRCAVQAESTTDPEHGAGVSVGRWFRNVNWVATPDHALFYGTDLAPGERLTEGRLAQSVLKAVRLGVFKGVEVHEWTRGPDRSVERFAAEESIGTDFGLRYARNLFCARVPVTAPQMDEIIAFLNDKNHEFATGAYDYNWNLLADNCVHTLRNALSAAHFWGPMGVLELKIRHLFNPATPANEFVNLAVLAADGPLSTPAGIDEERPLDNALFDFDWLPTRHGALVKTWPIHAENDLFDPTFRLFAVQSPLRMQTSARAIAVMSDPAHVAFEPNLRRSIARYDEAIAAREAAQTGLASVRGDALRRLDRAHLAWLRRERADAAAMLDALLARRAERAG